MRLAFLFALCEDGTLLALEGCPETDPGLTTAPKTEKAKPLDEAVRLLEHTWWVGTLTDTSTLYKGFVSLSGYKVRPGGLRIALKQEETRAAGTK